jgi:hypothetical protein
MKRTLFPQMNPDCQISNTLGMAYIISSKLSVAHVLCENVLHHVFEVSMGLSRLLAGREPGRRIQTDLARNNQASFMSYDGPGLTQHSMIHELGDQTETADPKSHTDRGMTERFRIRARLVNLALHRYERH